MSERKKERRPRQRIGKRRNSSKPLTGRATKKGAQRARAPFGPEFPITIGHLLLGYFVIGARDYEALTPEKASLGLFRDAMPAVHAIFEQLYPPFKST